MRAETTRAMSALPHTADDVAPQHRLWWQPGTPGRGVLFESGLVCSWPEGDATHRQYADRVPARPVMFFNIRRNGRVRIPERHAARAPRLIAALTAADPRLAPFAPPSHSGPAATRPAEGSGCSAPATGHGGPAGHRWGEWDHQAAHRLARIQRRY
jgi:hypothetical protein